MKFPEKTNQIDQWKSIMFLYDSALKEINTKIEILNNEFVQINDYNPIEHVKARLKTPESIVKKLKRSGYAVTIENMVEKLSDIAGIRIICSFRSDIYLLADMISRQRDVNVLYVKDYIKNPKPNGYRSYHMVVTVPIYLNEEMVETKVELESWFSFWFPPAKIDDGLGRATKNPFAAPAAWQKRRKDENLPRYHSSLPPQGDTLTGIPSYPRPVTGAPVRAYCCSARLLVQPVRQVWKLRASHRAALL